MRIISKFRDYYDVVMKQGMDREVVYVRETREIIIPDKYKLYRTNSYNNQPEVNCFILGFCGEIWFIYETVNKIKTEPYGYTHDLKTYFYKSANSVPVTEKKKWRWTTGEEDMLSQSLTELKNIFHEYQVPVFLITKGVNDYPNNKRHQKLVLNPVLQIMDFARFKDPYTCYQEIFQFVAGTLNRPENKMVTISDKDKIAKHGYDKWSFRKPGKKGMK